METELICPQSCFVSEDTPVLGSNQKSITKAACLAFSRPCGNMMCQFHRSAGSRLEHGAKLTLLARGFEKRRRRFGVYLTGRRSCSRFDGHDFCTTMTLFYTLSHSLLM